MRDRRRKSTPRDGDPAAAAAPKLPDRWSAGRKTELVLRLLRGERCGILRQILPRIARGLPRHPPIRPQVQTRHFQMWALNGHIGVVGVVERRRVALGNRKLPTRLFRGLSDLSRLRVLVALRDGPLGAKYGLVAWERAISGRQARTGPPRGGRGGPGNDRAHRCGGGLG